MWSDRARLAGSRSSACADDLGTLRLLRAYREGDERALEQIFDQHGRLLSHIVRRYVRSSGESYEALLQVGYVGLVKAVRGYDPSEAGSGARFSSYAYAMIDGELRHHFRDTGLVKRPRWARSLYARVSEATARLSARAAAPAAARGGGARGGRHAGGCDGALEAILRHRGLLAGRSRRGGGSLGHQESSVRDLLVAGGRQDSSRGVAADSH